MPASLLWKYVMRRFAILLSLSLCSLSVVAQDKPADEKGKPGASAPQAKGASKVPSKLVQDMKNAQGELTAQENLLAVKKKEVETINAKYDEDKRRYAELTKRSK